MGSRLQKQRELRKEARLGVGGELHVCSWVEEDVWDQGFMASFPTQQNEAGHVE